jgi:hypothetical protein
VAKKIPDPPPVFHWCQACRRYLKADEVEKHVAVVVVDPPWMAGR